MTRLTDERLAALYDGHGMGGERTARARVIRELIDEIRRLRAEATRPGRSGRGAAGAGEPGHQ